MKEINPLPVEKMKKESKLIQGIETSKTLNFDKSGFIGLMQSLNPLQFASEAIAQIAYYKHQVKVLEIEQERINAEANIRHHQIDAALQAGLQLLEERRIALQTALEAVTKDLENTHIEKKQILDCVDNLVKSICNPELSSEDKKIAHSTIATLTDTLKIMGKESTIKLDLIAKNTQKSLEAVPRNDLILTFSET